MPLYEFKCNYCDRHEEYVYMPIGERDNPKVCEDCNEYMERVFTSHKSKPFTPYYNLSLGSWCSSRSEEKSIAKKMGLVDITGSFSKSTRKDNGRL